MASWMHGETEARQEVNRYPYRGCRPGCARRHCKRPRPICGFLYPRGNQGLGTRPSSKDCQAGSRHRAAVLGSSLPYSHAICERVARRRHAAASVGWPPRHAPHVPKRRAGRYRESASVRASRFSLHLSPRKLLKRGVPFGIGLGIQKAPAGGVRQRCLTTYMSFVCKSL